MFVIISIRSDDCWSEGFSLNISSSLTYRRDKAVPILIKHPESVFDLILNIAVIEVPGPVLFVL